MEIKFTQWNKNYAPKKVLFIRLQAMGDTVITLPYIKGFKNANPNTTIHFLTRAEVYSIPYGSGIFSKVWVLKGRRNPKLQLIYLLFMLPSLWLQGYDIIFDLQNNILTNILIKVLRPNAWSSFNKFFPAPAGDRVEKTITPVLNQKVYPDFEFLKSVKEVGEDILKKNNLKKKDQLLVCLNPAGAFETRNWSIENYIRVASLLKKHISKEIYFIFLGDSRIEEKVSLISKGLKGNFVNLVSKTSPFEAIAVLQNLDLMISEDSGLMHMNWVTGIPTLAIFGSSRSDWSRPLGAHSHILDSSDMECGNCLMAKCKFEKIKCLERYTPEIVCQEAITLLKKCKRIEKE